MVFFVVVVWWCFCGGVLGCMIFYVFVAFYNLIYSNQVKHSAKHREIGHLFGLCKLRSSK